MCFLLLGSIPFHLNPAELTPSVSGVELWSLYVDVLSHVVEGKYEEAQLLINSTLELSPPEELSYLIDRYRELVQELTSLLIKLEEKVDLAEAALKVNDIEEAKRLVDEAEVLAGRALLLVDDLVAASELLAAKIGVLASPEGKDLHEQLMKLLDRLKECVLKLLSRTREAESTLEEREASLVQTNLTLFLVPPATPVGGVFLAVGVLLSNEGPLPGRLIEVKVDGVRAAATYTFVNGVYIAVVKAPYAFVEQARVQAVYVPRGSDLEKYAYSESEVESLALIFQRTSLLVHAPGSSYVGMPLTINGAVMVDGRPSPNREVDVFLSGVLVGRAFSDEEGCFALSFTPPATKPKSLTLKVTSPPVGLASDASSSISVELVQADVELSLRAPSFIVLPSPIVVEGSFNSTLPCSGRGVVEVKLGGAVKLVEAEDGAFKANVTLPLLSSMSGLYSLEVYVKPMEAWNGARRASTRVLVINPLNLALAFLLATVVVAALRRRGRELTLEVEGLAEAQPISVARHVPQALLAELSGARREVLEAYRTALRKVEEATGLYLQPSHTLREYLGLVADGLGDRLEPFTKLTELAERALYAEREPSFDEVEEAKRLIEVFKG